MRLVAVRNKNCGRKSTRWSIASGSIQTLYTKEDITRLILIGSLSIYRHVIWLIEFDTDCQRYRTWLIDNQSG
jgi:hypothetical protein